MIFESTGWQIAAIICWISLGALFVWVLWLYSDMQKLQENHMFYDTLLDKPCWIRSMDDGQLVKYRIVAVSHKGALNIRRWDDDSGKHAIWIKASEVPRKVFFEEVGSDA